MSKRKIVQQKLRDMRRIDLPIAIYETSVMVDIVLGNMSTSLLRNAQANFNVAVVNGFFKRFDDRVGPMDRLILAGSINIKPARFVTLDHDFLDLREEISRELGIIVKTALP